MSISVIHRKSKKIIFLTNQRSSLRSVGILVISSTFCAMKFFVTCHLGVAVAQNSGLPALRKKMFLSTATPYWHVTTNFMAQKLLEITQIPTLRIELLWFLKIWFVWLSKNHTSEHIPCTHRADLLKPIHLYFCAFSRG